MNAKPQEFPVTEPLKIDLKQANRTKRPILINNGFLANEIWMSNEHYPQKNQNFHQNNLKVKSQPLESGSSVQFGNFVINTPSFDRSLNYSQYYWKTYIENEIIVAEMKQSIAKVKETQAQISALEQECQGLEKTLQSNFKKETKKKNRRTANEIVKSFTCPYQNCNKNYGSDVSLNLHIKLKHNGGNKTEREKLARTIYIAKMNGEDVPDVNLNLPPGFLDGMNKTKLLKEKSIKKERSATKEKDMEGSDEKTGLSKNETPGKMEKEDYLEKQPSHDSNSTGTTQDLSRKTTNTMLHVLPTEQYINSIN